MSSGHRFSRKGKIINSIEDKVVVEDLLRHFGFLDLKVRSPLKVKAPLVAISIDNSDSKDPFPLLPGPEWPG